MDVLGKIWQRHKKNDPAGEQLGNRFDVLRISRNGLATQRIGYTKGKTETASNGQRL